MGYGICAEDMAAICITLAGGQIGMRMREVVERAEALQEEHDDYFGVSDRDFRMSFFRLGVENGLYDLGILGLEGEMPDAFDQPLSFWCEQMLRWSDVYFNDEGEHWDEWPDLYPEHRAALRAFLRRTESFSAPQRMEALLQLGWPRDAPPRYLRAHCWDNVTFVPDETYPYNIIPSRLGRALCHGSGRSRL